MTIIEAALKLWAKQCGVPPPIREVRFHPPRRWRFDYAWPEHKVAVEVEGGVWIRGRHTRGKGFLADMNKYNQATADGWRVLRTTPNTLQEVVPHLQQLLRGE